MPSNQAYPRALGHLKHQRLKSVKYMNVKVHVLNHAKNFQSALDSGRVPRGRDTAGPHVVCFMACSWLGLCYARYEVDQVAPALNEGKLGCGRCGVMLKLSLPMSEQMRCEAVEWWPFSAAF